MCSEYFFLRLKFIALVPIYFKIDLEYILQNKYSWPNNCFRWNKFWPRSPYFKKYPKYFFIFFIKYFFKF